MEILNYKKTNNDILIRRYVILGYFLIYALSGFFNMLGLPGGTLLTLYTLIITYLALEFLVVNGKTRDWAFFFFVIILILSSFSNNYQSELLWKAIREVPWMLFYYIGRSGIVKDDGLFKYGLPVFLIVCIAGLYLFITMPSWYLEMKLANTDSARTDAYVLEMSRLSAFWPFPYWISYGGGIMYTYILCYSYKIGKLNYRVITALLFIILILLLAQQRGPLLWIFMVTIVILFISPNIKGSFVLLCTMAIASVVVYYLSIMIMGDEMFERLLLKVETSSDAGVFLSDRAQLFSDFYKKEVTLFGDGLGRYSHAALRYGKSAITDQNYLKILYENGIFGCIGYSLFIINSFLLGLKRYKANVFELGIVIMYLLCMTGSNCISVSEEHSALFWFCCGRLTIVRKTNSLKMPKQ